MLIIRVFVLRFIRGIWLPKTITIATAQTNFPNSRSVLISPPATRHFASRSTIPRRSFSWAYSNMDGMLSFINISIDIKAKL